MNRLRYILRHRYIIKIFALIILIISILRISLIKKESIYHDETVFTGIIYKIKIKDNKTTIYLNAKEKLIVNYYNIDNNLKLGDLIEVTGELTIPNNNTIPNLFNYRKYLYNNDIFYIVKASSINKIANNTNIIYHLKDKLSNRISKIKYSHEYIELFVLGNNNYLEEDIKNSFKFNGISHLFSISGMHISLFVSIIIYILKRISYNNYFNYGIVILFLIFYSLLIGNSPSIIRSLIMYILFTINKLFNLKINKIDIMLLVLVIIILINPYYLLNTSFEYSYLISFYLILFSNKIKKCKTKLHKSLCISYISFLVAFPITIYNSFEVNIISIILNIIFVPLISFIVFPLSLIILLIPKISFLIYPFIKLIECISLFISSNKIGFIIFNKPSLLIIIIYYILITLFIYNYKYFYLIILIIFHKLYPYIDNSFYIQVLDVGQGDSILLSYPHNTNTLIDTGGNYLSNNSFALTNTIPYLKSKGLTKLNYLIITHGDFDHVGEAINLVNNFKVEKVIFNCGPYNDLEKELIKVLDKKKIPYYSCVKELNIDKNKLYFLQTKIYDNENDNSNVIYTKFNGYKFLLMGDASSITEKEIMNKYNLPDIDVLKVGHHGSKTSSSEEFINEINPKYSIISVGKNNRYGHPNKEVLDNLKDSKIYRTDEDGSIMFKIKNNKSKIETCSP